MIASIHGIFQARILQWVAIPFSRRSSWPEDWTWVSYIAGEFFTIWVTREAQIGAATVENSMEVPKKNPTLLLMSINMH